MSVRVVVYHRHYIDVIMDAIASQITSLTIVYLIVYSCGDQRKHQNSTSLAFVRGIHRWPVNSPHKWPVTRKMFPLDDVIMECDYDDLPIYAPVEAYNRMWLSPPFDVCQRCYLSPNVTMWLCSPSNICQHWCMSRNVTYNYSETCLQRPPNGILLCLLELI